MRRLAALALAGAAVAPASCGGETKVIVPSGAMLPGLEMGDEVEIDDSAYGDTRPVLGDVVVFLAPRGIEEGACGVRAKPRQPCPRATPPTRDVRLIGRVVAEPGEKVAFREGIAVVDGEVEQERDLQIDDPACDACELPVEITVPRDHVFIAGDNRSSGVADSRLLGPIPYRSVTGRVGG